MKRNGLLISSLLAVFFSIITLSNTSGQIAIGSNPDTIAYVDEPYTYDVYAETTPGKIPITYSLIKSLSGMTINSGSGLISWTPNNITDGGKVVVRAKNNVNEADTQKFFIYVSDSILCPPTMEAYWKFDEENGPSYYDYYGKNYASVDVTGNAPVSVTGKINRAQEFNPLNTTRLIVPVDTVFDWGAEDPFSIEFWFSLNEENLDSTGVIIGKNDGETGVHWWIGIDGNKKIKFIIRKTTGGEIAECVSNNSVDLGWHHVVAVRDAPANTIYLYIDNALASSKVDYQGWPPGFISASDLCIGWLKPGTGDKSFYPFNGKLDELIIHDTVLTAQDISKSYLKGNAGKPACQDGNFAPLFLSDPQTEILENSFYTYQYLANDIDGDPLDYDVVEKPAWLSWNEGTRTLYGTPVNEDVGLSDVSIMVSDSKVDVYQDFQITVHNVNDAPQLSGIEGSALSFTEGDDPVNLTASILVTDVDDINIESASVSITTNYRNGEDVLSFTNTANITGTWNSSSGVLSLAGSDTKANFQAAIRTVTYENVSEDPTAVARTISFRIYDGDDYSNTLTRNISIIPVNDPPVITGHLSVSTPEDDTVLIKPGYIIYTDVDNTPGEITVTVNNGTNYSHVGNIVTPAANYSGTISVNLQLKDPESSVDYVLPVTVSPVNDPPYFTFDSIPVYAYEGQFYYFSLSAHDVDAGDVLTFSAPQKPAWLQLSGNLLSGKPGFHNVGPNTVTLRVTDSKVNVDTTFVINVIMTNHKPYIYSTPETSIDEDDDYVYNIQYTDPDVTDILVLYGDIIPNWLTLDLNQKKLSGKPTNSQVGYKPDSTYVVKLRVSDTKQDSTQTFTITVSNINDAPVISGQVLTPDTYADSSLSITMDDLLVEDVDNPMSDLTLTIFSGTGYSIVGNTITINHGVLGLVMVKVVVDDGVLESNEYNYKINVKLLTGIDKPVAQDNPVIKVYPNPAVESVKFEISLNDNGWIEIFSNQGRLILKRSVDKNNNVFEINTGGIPCGIYSYKIYNDHEIFTGKLIIR
jgi:hypothetical protein